MQVQTVVRSRAMNEKQNDKIECLLTFLMILVHRNGGRMEIEKLSDYLGRQLQLKMKLEPKNDKVILTTYERCH